MNELLADPMFFRGLERLFIAAGSVVFAFLGYRLFVRGITRGKSELKTQSPLFSVVLSGTGPGLFFMAFGAIVLIFSVFSKAETDERGLDPGTAQLLGELIALQSANVSAELGETDAFSRDLESFVRETLEYQFRSRQKMYRVAPQPPSFRAPAERLGRLSTLADQYDALRRSLDDLTGQPPVDSSER